MSERRSRERLGAGLSGRQRGWLRHVRAADRAGGTIKDYAARNGVSVQSLYQARKRLRRLGVLEPRVQPVRRPFVKVERTTACPGAGAVWRVRLASGTVFESSAPLGHDELVSLLSALAAPR